MMKTMISATLVALCTVSTALADGFRPVTDRSEFLEIVANRSLQIPIYGVDLRVRPDGRIQGKGAGREVKGQWRWTGAFFCRDLYWGARDLGPNCQEVRVSGNKVRFTSDKGAGRSADFRIR